MQQIHLKKIRVVASLTFFVLSFLLFVDYDRVNNLVGATTVAIYPQFVPSLLLLVQEWAGAATGCLFVIVLTLLFGRVYCAMICPLGTLQDIIIHIAARLRKARVKFKYQPPHDVLRYSVLALTIGVWFSGSALVWRWLDPFSNFGRIVSDLVRPLYVLVHHYTGTLVEMLGWYGPIPLQWKAPPPITWLFPALFLMGLIIASAFKGRLFCNTLCPVGTVLGLIARAALFKIRIPKDACIVCAQCSMQCKAGCIRLKTREVDFSRCVACFNCITACGKGHGIGYALSLPSASPADISHTDNSGISRRAALRASGITLIGWAIVPRSVGAAPQKLPIAPPGAVNLAQFNDRCTACHLCVGVCPYGVLQPAVLEYGIAGLLQPRMDYHTGYCSYLCNRCGHVCPTGALQPLTLATKQMTSLGIAQFSRNACVRYTHGIPCARCESNCPTEAVRIIPLENELALPTVQAALCIGCGACEYACPARPERAITVHGHAQQRPTLRALLQLDRAP